MCQRTGGQSLSLKDDDPACLDPEYEHQKNNDHSRISQLPPTTMYGDWDKGSKLKR